MALGLALSAALFFSIPQLASADSARSRSLEANFKTSYFSAYEEGRCGDNILGFLTANRGLGLTDAKVLMIENKGYSVFGMLNVERAREAGGMIRPQPARAPFRKEGEKNWYHHVVLLFEGRIYDFDFTNEPVVLPVAQYFEEMFLDEEPQPGYGGFYVGRDDKLNEYQIEVINGADALDRGRNGNPVTRKFKLGEFLQTVR
jgi:hypothetical protein